MLKIRTNNIKNTDFPRELTRGYTTEVKIIQYRPIKLCNKKKNTYA